MVAHRPVEKVTVATPSRPAGEARRTAPPLRQPRPAHPRSTATWPHCPPREREVLALMGRGLSNTELAEALTLSEATVKTHVARIFAKLAPRDRAQAVVLAYETGLVAPGGE
ncbi:response regulator transcription factor [Streptomyces sp. NPDC093060]|uniref:response regulator transcription factor n=1 Tax=Streptomyces sp. NPDC093060 TaxID=3366019 RepID=UPI00382CD868